MLRLKILAESIVAREVALLWNLGLGQIEDIQGYWHIKRVKLHRVFLCGEMCAPMWWLVMILLLRRVLEF